MIFLVFLLMAEVLTSKGDVNELFDKLFKSENFEVLAEKIANKTIEKIQKLNIDSFSIKNYENAEYRTKEDKSTENYETNSNSTSNNNLDDDTDELSKQDETKSDLSSSVSRPKVVLQFKEFVRSNEKEIEDIKSGSVEKETKSGKKANKVAQKFTKEPKPQNKSDASKEIRKKENLRKDKVDNQDAQKQEKHDMAKNLDGRRAITRYIYVDSTELKKSKPEVDSETDFLSDNNRNRDISTESES